MPQEQHGPAEELAGYTTVGDWLARIFHEVRSTDS
jgi:hypothetical protein